MTACEHIESIDLEVRPSADGCEDCLRTGGDWVHLRVCQQCGHVGCCDSSPNRHATEHHRHTDHPPLPSGTTSVSGGGACSRPS